jgi:predicted RNA-binding Zn-ribbon protein involved in translation (DUF1610 family)
MSKQEESGGGGTKSLRDDLLEKERELIRTRAELEEMKASNKKLSTQNSKLRKKADDPEDSGPTGPETQDEPKAPSPPPPSPSPSSGGLQSAEGGTKTTANHVVASWEPEWCPDCGTRNPKYEKSKPEDPLVKCATCNVKLGTQSEAAKMKACPNCGPTTKGWLFV